MEKRYNELKLKIKSYYKGRVSFEILNKAWEYAKGAHLDQKRISGKDFITHPLEVAHLLADWKMDFTSIVSAILHDVIDRGAGSEKDIKSEFGDEISNLVTGVSSVSVVKFKQNKKQMYIENIRKMFFAMAKDLRVVVIKIAERLHNLQTLSVMSPKQIKHTATESIEIFAPLAERLGMGEVKGQIEDLSFSYLYPKEYEKVVKLSSEFYDQSLIDLEKMKKMINKKLSNKVNSFRVYGRRKRLYSLWKKLERRNINWDKDKVDDIVALRVVTSEVDDCYTALGIVHRLFKPILSEPVSDYIAQPKPNGYQSIHTRVIAPSGRRAEVQIRTEDMDFEAEYGVAAHWYMSQMKYKKGATSEQIDRGIFMANSKKLSWVKQLADWQKQLVDSKEFIDAVKFDALSERIFVFSPKGDVYDLPIGSTPIDYAFSVHTELGFHIKSALVNGKMVSLRKKLSNGDVVEIVKSKSSKPPTKDWINYVRTTVAKREIKKHLKRM